jgi:hypothetical protein
VFLLAAVVRLTQPGDERVFDVVCLLEAKAVCK